MTGRAKLISIIPRIVYERHCRLVYAIVRSKQFERDVKCDIVELIYLLVFSARTGQTNDKNRNDIIRHHVC